MINYTIICKKGTHTLIDTDTGIILKDWPGAWIVAVVKFLLLILIMFYVLKKSEP